MLNKICPARIKTLAGFSPLDKKYLMGFSFSKGFTPLDSKPRGIENIQRGKHLTGFTLGEIIVVIAIISVVLIFSIPYINKMTMQANETDAITSLGKLSAAMEVYRILNKSYPSTLSDLVTVNPTISLPLLSMGSKRGYNFSLDSASLSRNTYAIIAEPKISGETGNYKFKVDHTGNIYSADATPASAWGEIGGQTQLLP